MADYYCSLFPSYCPLHLFLKFSEIPNPKFPLYLCNPGPGHRTTEERPGARQPGPQDAVAHLPSSIPKRCHASNLPPHSFPCYLWSLDLTLCVFRCVTGAHPVPEADLVVPPRWRGHRRRRCLSRLAQPPLPPGLGCAATARPLRERRHRLPARLGSVAVARSWWSAAVGRPPRGGTAVGPQDRRRSHARGNRRRR